MAPKSMYIHPDMKFTKNKGGGYRMEPATAKDAKGARKEQMKKFVRSKR